GTKRLFIYSPQLVITSIDEYTFKTLEPPMNSKTPSLVPFAPVPLYFQLKEILRAQILDGSYPAESRMPSESELGEQFQVSRITVRQALGDLQKEGLIFKIHGKGTFVAKPKAF